MRCKSFLLLCKPHLLESDHPLQEYPWPPGKAPWSLEMGGAGIPPDGARENWGKNAYRDTLLEQAKPEVKEERERQERPAKR